MENLEKKDSVIEDKEVFKKLIEPLPACARIELTQLINGLRPVAEITVVPKFRDTMIPVVDSLKSLGFAVAQGERDAGIYMYFVSNHQNLADEAVETRDPKRFGELMGFPDTSIEAFLHKDDGTLLEGKELTQLLGFKNYCFPFRVSKNVTEDELHYLRESYRILLEQSPQLIDSMLPIEIDKDEFKKRVSVFVYGQKSNSDNMGI